MRLKVAFTLACTFLAAVAGSASAGHLGACGYPDRGSGLEQCCFPCVQYRVCYQTVCEDQPFTCYRPVYQTVMTTQRYTTCRAVYEQHCRTERYTVCRP